MPRTTKNATTKATPKATTKAKADPFAKVADDGTVTSGAIAYSLLDSESGYLLRVATLGPILAKREAAGQSQADIAREMVSVAKDNGKAITLAAAKMKVSRYVRIGAAIVKAPKDEDIADTVRKASAAVRGSKGPGSKGPKTPKDPGTLVSALSGTVGAVVDAVTERGTVADADALLALAHDLVKRATAARDLVGKRAA